MVLKKSSSQPQGLYNTVQSCSVTIILILGVHQMGDLGDKVARFRINDFLKGGLLEFS